jgi:glycosyltransferase involved in cell wall biosynthesis
MPEIGHVVASHPLPLISVIMPVYNGEKYLNEAVESILGQSFADFELIVIDDGSTDGSAAILESFCQNDVRVIIRQHSQNQGITVALNTGLALARGKYIARMDADDISLSERFEKQVAFLEKHPEIDVIGSAVQMINERGQKIGVLPSPLDDLAIRWKGLFSASFLHPTVMLRHSVLIEHNIRYRVSRNQPEDFDFFTQLLEHARGANLPEPLLLYRVHSNSLTSQFLKDKLSTKAVLILRNLQARFPGLAISHDQVVLVSGALHGRLSVPWRRAEASEIYLQVWQAFSEDYTPDQAFYRLQTNVVMIASKLALFPPFQPGWRKAMRKIIKIEPKWLIKFIQKFPEMVSTKISSWLIRKNRI